MCMHMLTLEAGRRKWTENGTSGWSVSHDCSSTCPAQLQQLHQHCLICEAALHWKESLAVRHKSSSVPAVRQRGNSYLKGHLSSVWVAITGPYIHSVSKSVWILCLAAQSCPTLGEPTDCNPPGSSVHGIIPARILEWAVIFFPVESFQPRDWTCSSWIGRKILYYRVSWEASLSLAP